MRRAFALAAAILFVLSWVFPVGAGLVGNPTILPRWWGTVDVALAFVVALRRLPFRDWLTDRQTNKQSRPRIGSIGACCTRY